MKRLLIALLAIALVVVIADVSFAAPAAKWSKGDEKAIFGHTFEEESWYTTVTNTTKDNNTAEFGVSFVDMGDIEAFLITLNKVTDPEGGIGVLPYQMFGMHYYTKKSDGVNSNEVFIGALLAFLAVYNDTNNDGIPNVGEQFFYVIPFGLGDTLKGEYVPEVTNNGVTKISEGHYQMGITYKNLYALATENYFASMWLRTGWVLKFSELTVTYDIKLDKETGTVTAETHYTVGEITSLWGVFLNIPIPVKDVQKTIPDNFGLAAVHFTTVFTSNYKVINNETGADLNTNIDQVISGSVAIDSQGQRAFELGFRGNYDLIDEPSTTINSSMPAKNLILQAKLNDLILVAWQLGFSAAVFVAMAYGLSSYVRGLFDSQTAMVDSSTAQANPKGFGAQAFWYGVCFPKWNGYRVVHDPVYTAFFGNAATTEPEKKTPGFEAIFVLTVLASLVAVHAIISRRR